MSDIASAIQAISIMLACWAVISGVDAWKRDFIGKRRIELAEQLLAKFFEVKDAVGYIRNPWSTSEEGKTRQRSDSEPPDESKILDRGYIAVERYQTKEEVFAEFNTLKYRAMAAFGTDTEEIFTETSKVVNSIFTSARMLGTYYWQQQMTRSATPDDYQNHLKEMRSHEKKIWDVGPDDEVRTALLSIQVHLEKITSPIFTESMKSYSILTRKWFPRS